MHRDSVGFERTFRRHLGIEQRRAVLETLANAIDPDASLGDVLDAADTLGWGEQMGQLSLADLAEALLAEPGEEAQSTESPTPAAREHETTVSADEAAHNDAQPAKGGRKKAGKAAKKAASTRTTTARGKAKKGATSPRSTTSKKSKPTSTTARGKKAAAAKATTGRGGTKGRKRGGLATARMRALQKKIDADEPMSLEEAAELLIPMVEAMGEATMQALEESTGIARRKLRFHIGQLVKHEYLERHGMGRGTSYTVA